MTASQSGFTAWFDLTDSTGWLPSGYARVTVQLPSRFSYRLTETAVFQDGWVYRIDEDRRLQAEAVDILGINRADERRRLIMQGPDLAGDLRLLTTRLNNPMTGMRVHEPGVDPDPEPAVDEDAEQPELDSKAAIIEASCQRFRAVMLTFITTVAGLIPILMADSVQAQLVQSMATSLAFGLSYGTLLVLVVIPATLTYIESANNRRQQFGGWVKRRVFS